MLKQNILIRAANLSKNLGTRTILKSINLQVSTGERIALMGANGSGKTTLLRLLASASRPTTGEIEWFGRKTTLIERKREIGLVGHESRLYPHLTAIENLSFAARMHALSNAKRQVEWWIESTGTKDFQHRLPTQLSRGMRQRLAIARGLIHHPKLMILDEPFSGLDAESRDWVIGVLLDRVRQDCALLFSTHDPLDIASLSACVVTLHAGRHQEGETVGLQPTAIPKSRVCAA
jgi:heme exporter protein A